jgi:hypothetical protein
MSGVRFTGTFERLHQLGEHLSRLAGHGYEDALHRSEVALQLQLDKQYAAGESPAGIGWKAKRDGTGRSYLQRSGDMRRSTKAVRGVKGITITAPKPAGFHQKGTRKMTQRRIVPDSLGAAPAWDEAVRTACLEALSAGFR